MHHEGGRTAPPVTTKAEGQHRQPPKAKTIPNHRHGVRTPTLDLLEGHLPGGHQSPYSALDILSDWGYAVVRNPMHFVCRAAWPFSSLQPVAAVKNVWHVDIDV